MDFIDSDRAFNSQGRSYCGNRAHSHDRLYKRGGFWPRLLLIMIGIDTVPSLNNLIVEQKQECRLVGRLGLHKIMSSIKMTANRGFLWSAVLCSVTFSDFSSAVQEAGSETIYEYPKLAWHSIRVQIGALPKALPTAAWMIETEVLAASERSEMQDTATGPSPSTRSAPRSRHRRWMTGPRLARSSRCPPERCE